MIKFEGDVNRLIKNYLLRKFFFFGAIVGLFLVLFYALISGFAFMGIENPWFLILLAVVLYVGIVVGFCCLVGGALPMCIEVEQESILITSKDGGYGTRKIEQVKKIIDNGDFYVIKFYFPEQCINCVIQKDLIVEGTIEQFEEMFKDKIVRKVKSK